MAVTSDAITRMQRMSTLDPVLAVRAAVLALRQLVPGVRTMAEALAKANGMPDEQLRQALEQTEAEWFNKEERGSVA